MADFELARLRKQIPVKAASLGYKLDRREACVSGVWLHTWHMDIEHTERVVRHKHADAASATRAFRAWVAALRKDGYEVVPPKTIGWTIGPRGQRTYFNTGKWSGAKPWSKDVEVVVESGKTTKVKAPEAPQVIERDDDALAKLAKTRPPSPSATFAAMVEQTNAWFAALVAAGLPLEDRDWDATAIVTSGAYSAKDVKTGERASNMKLPKSYADQLRSIGDVAVLGRHGRESTYPLLKRAGWPLQGTLAEATRVLYWEVERHGEPGSFTPKAIAAKRWLRIAANAPGGSDHNFIMDLANTRSGEPAIYRVDDIGLPTEITKTATVYGMRAWLRAQIVALYALVEEAVRRAGPRRASRPARRKRRAP